MNMDFVEVFIALRSYYSAYADQCVVVQDDETRYFLGSHEVRAKDGYRTDFGGVEIKKNYVSAHLMPVYIHPELAIPVSSDLKKHQHGKSCFKFKKVDQRLFHEFGDLVATSIAKFKADGRI